MEIKNARIRLTDSVSSVELVGDMDDDGTDVISIKSMLYAGNDADARDCLARLNQLVAWFPWFPLSPSSAIILSMEAFDVTDEPTLSEQSNVVPVSLYVAQGETLVTVDNEQIGLETHLMLTLLRR